MTIFMAIIGGCRGLLPSDEIMTTPEVKMKDVIKYTHYSPKSGIIKNIQIEYTRNSPSCLTIKSTHGSLNYGMLSYYPIHVYLYFLNIVVISLPL